MAAQVATAIRDPRRFPGGPAGQTARTPPLTRLPQYKVTRRPLLAPPPAGAWTGELPSPAQVAIAIRDPRCFPAGPAPGPIYLPPLPGRESNALGSALRQAGAFWLAIAAAATASIVSAGIAHQAGRPAAPAFDRDVASVYRQAEDSFVGRWGEFGFASNESEESLSAGWTKPVKTIRFARPVPQTDAQDDSAVASATAGYSLASVDPRQIDIDKPTRGKEAADLDEVSQYLWEVYLRVPTKKDGSGDFTWKDPAAAKRVGMSLPKYVIAGMDPDFREQLYHAGRAMDAAGVKWSILSAFRDDYRQRIASGIKAGARNSLHGGSLRTGGYGYGRAVDVTNVNEDDAETVWKWFDANGAKFGLYRPMPGYDPAHIQSRADWHKVAASLRQARIKAAKARPPAQAQADTANTVASVTQ